MTVNARMEGFNFCCGAAEIGRFQSTRDGYSFITLHEQIENSDEYVFKIATFTNTKTQREAYEQLCKELKLVTQTVPKRNPKSGNKVFVAVFTNKDK